MSDQLTAEVWSSPRGTISHYWQGGSARTLCGANIQIDWKPFMVGPLCARCNNSIREVDISDE